MKKVLKSIGAALIGIIVGVVLSLGSDYVFEVAGVLPHGSLWVPASIIIFVLLYRVVFNIMGSYIVARLAPHKPMKHVLIVGAIGTVASIIGAIVTSGMNLGPAWYAWTLALLSMPSAWVGGKLYEEVKR